MTISVIGLVLVAAVLHAVWNAAVKGAQDRMLSMGLLCLGHALPALFLIPFVSVPPLAVWPYLAASLAIHWGYYWLLTVAYRLGDLSVVYPVSRGLAPVMVALGAMLFAGEVLPWAAWCGILLISGGLMALTFEKGLRGVASPALGAAGLVALSVTAYSLVDGMGVRIVREAIDYIVWIFALEGSFAAWALWSRRGVLRTTSPKALWIGVIGGLISALAYGLVLSAKTLAPIGMVSALRETSVIVAALIGVWWFHERPIGVRVGAAVVVCAGVAVLVLL